MTANCCRKYSLQPVQVKWNHHCIPWLGHTGKDRLEELWDNFSTAMSCWGASEWTLKTSLQEITQRSWSPQPSCSPAIQLCSISQLEAASPWHPWTAAHFCIARVFWSLPACSCIPDIPPAARMICPEQSGSLWLLGSLCSFPILITWALWNT